MSKIKVNTIAPRSGTTVTLGEAGDTIALGACASQTGFGRTGTVDWCTTVKTSPLTAVSGKGYFVNTTGGAITVTLPASPSAGDIVSLKDYKDTWATACKAVTLGRNSSKISGLCIDATLKTAGQSITMIYVDGTQGWENIQTDTTVVGSDFITATGGTITTSGDYKIHTFTADACFAVSEVSAATPANNKVDYLVVAGGGSGGGEDRQSVGAGGGGGGGFRVSDETYCASGSPGEPLANATGITVSATSYPIVVGGGGTGAATSPGGAPGSNSSALGLTSAGGGMGGFTGGPATSPSPTSNPRAGTPGGSGGGASHNMAGQPGGNGNDPSVSPAQGTNGGPATPSTYLGGGGGGAKVAGTGGGGNPGPGGAGGGLPNALGTSGQNCGSYYYFSGGGGGGGSTSRPTTGAGGGAGLGGGGAGGTGNQNPTDAGAGTTNTGGGGGGAGNSYPSGTGDIAGANGGSGIVILRYKYQ